MSNIKLDLSHILDWKLLDGSHDFPGPEGGTCINEAAIVAAGFEYRSIGSAHDCPPCFSRPIAAYAIKINDSMPDALRQELLLPFVTRLAGSADTPEVERQRVEYMALETIRRILSRVLRSQNLEALALRCERAVTLTEARDVAREARDTLRDAARREIWTIAAGILDGALRIGKQGDTIAVDLAVERMRAVRQSVEA